MKPTEIIQKLALLGTRFTRSELSAAAEFLGIGTEDVEKLLRVCIEDGRIVLRGEICEIADPSILSEKDTCLSSDDHIHLRLACLRENARSILFHAERSGMGKRRFAAWLLRNTYNAFRDSSNVNLTLERIRAIEMLVSDDLWALQNIRIYLSEMTDSGVEFSETLLEDFAFGRLHANLHLVLRAFQNRYPQEQLLEALTERKALPCTSFQSIVLDLFEARLRYSMKPKTEYIESLMERINDIRPISKCFVALKADMTNFVGLHFRKTGDMKRFKEMTHHAIDLAESYELNGFKARFFNNLSIIYMDSNPAYSQQIQKNVIEMSEKMGDFPLASVVSYNLALLHFFKGKRRGFDELLKKMKIYVSLTDNPEAAMLVKLTEILPQVYEGPSPVFEKTCSEAEILSNRIVGPQKETQVNKLCMSKILHYGFFGRFNECRQVFESHEFQPADLSEKALVEIIRAGIFETESPFDVFKRFREDMAEYIEDCLLFISGFISKEEYPEFRTICMDRLIRAQQTVSLFSQALIAHAVATASERLSVVNDSIRYFRIAATHYDVSGLFSVSRRLKEEHLKEGELLSSLDNIVKKLDERGLKDLRDEAAITLETVEEISHLIINSQNLAASLSDVSSITESMRTMLEFLLSFYPARTARCVLKWKEIEEVTIGEDEMPQKVEQQYSNSPFYVRYVFFVGYSEEVEIVLYNPSISVRDQVIKRFFRQMTFVEPILELSFKNYIRYTMAMKDSLTGLFTRWYFEARMEEQFKRAERYGEDFSVIFCDLDDFKRVNDRHGHLRGDETLTLVAQSIMSSCRESDVVCRFGGEEFVVLLPSAGLEEAVRLTERLKEAVSGCDPELKVTGSFGVASYSTSSPASARELVQHADDLCYQAKNKGKNRIECDLDE